MDINKEDILRMTALSDEVFKKKLEGALDSAQASQEMKDKLCANIPQIKQTLSSLTNEDLELISKRLDQATLNVVKDSLKQ